MTVEAVIGKLAQQPLVRQRLVRRDVEDPQIPLHALVHVELLAIGTDLNPVGRSHACREPRRLPVAVNPPELAGAVGPVGVTRVDGSVGSDGQIVGLVHLRVVREDGNLLRLQVHAQDVVPDIVRHIHGPRAVEDDAVAGAFAGQRDEDLGAAVRRGFADGLLFAEIHGVDVAAAVARRAFDARGELARLGHRAGCPERFGAGRGLATGRGAKRGQCEGERQTFEKGSRGDHDPEASAGADGLATEGLHGRLARKACTRFL